MLNGEQLTLNAMRKELKNLERKAAKAKADADERCNYGSEIIAARQEAADIMKTGDWGPANMKKLDELLLREKRAWKVSRKDLIKLLDKQSKAEIERDRLISEIHTLEFRMSLRGTA